jgi:tRNA modification GTPase
MLGGKTDAPRKATLETLVDPVAGHPLDQALTLWFPAPSSETGEDIAELHLHGGGAVITSVLRALGQMDQLEPAGPGDFARRAFHNGKLNLTRIEALSDLISAETEAQRAQAVRQLQGALSDLYDRWRAELIVCLAHIEVAVDFTDEDIPGDIIAVALREICTLEADIGRHLNDNRCGERVRSGYRVVIAGPPNAGKSSLLNALAQRDVAIVSDEPGTTRDVIDVVLDLGGFPVTVSDTAGIRDGVGNVEAEGVRRAQDRMKDADIVLWLRDITSPRAPAVPKEFSAKSIEVWSKGDLSAGPIDSCIISTRKDNGLDDLVDLLLLRVSVDTDRAFEGPLLTRARHRYAVERAHAALSRSMICDVSQPEIIAEELRGATHALGSITGRVDVEDLLGAIFSEFCIGK